MSNPSVHVPSRESLLGALFEAAELEHNLMCTYLYAAFSLKSGEAEGLSSEEAAAVARWKRAILDVAIDEMGHLTAVWNITAALGGSPRFGRGNFPLDPGYLPAGIVVKLAPFNEAVLQHFIYLERPEGSQERDGAGFEPEFSFRRGLRKAELTPMASDYETVGVFYASLGEHLREFVAHHGDEAAFCGNPALQLSEAEVALTGAKPVICVKTALNAFTRIIEQGEGAPSDSAGSHYHRFLDIRTELERLKRANPAFEPAFPAAVNPVLRPPLRPQGRVWIENDEAFACVDLANASYALMLRLLAYSYTVPRPLPEKNLSIDLGLGLMRTMTLLGERAARLPAGPSNPHCNAGMSFTALRDAAPLLPGKSAGRFFMERMSELAKVGEKLAASGDARMVNASRILSQLATRCVRGFERTASANVPAAAPAPIASAPAPAPTSVSQPQPGNGSTPPTPTVIDGIEHIEGKHLTLLFDSKRCIHARFCVTGAPQVFLANVKGPWINPDAIEPERLIEIAHACPSGAIRYRRKDDNKDDKQEETAPPVNLIAIREAGPYAFRGELRIAGEPAHYRATLCRCGASKNKPFCDGSHHDVGFNATGEPPSDQTDMLAVRNGPVDIEPQIDGPLDVRGNLEITSGTGRVVRRTSRAKLCRCGGSSTKPFCDGTHARIGFKSD